MLAASTPLEPGVGHSNSYTLINTGVWLGSVTLG